MMNVSFIGSGNVAWHLAPALDNTDFPVKEVFSRDLKKAEALVERLYHAQPKVTLDFSTSASRIFIIATADDAIEEVANNLILPERSFVFHTSGSQPLSALGYAPTNNIGVLYPLQTFSKKRKIQLQDVPFFIEAENAETEKVLNTLAKALTKKVYKIASVERKALHVAAVFASNFTNHLLALSKEIAEDHKLDFEYLKPLIIETVNKALADGPHASQTGPARRGDLELLDSHFAFLAHDEHKSEIYRAISQSILDHYGR